MKTDIYGENHHLKVENIRLKSDNQKLELRIKELEEQLTTSSVSQQSELLKAYDRWDEENCYKLRHLNLMQRIHIFLEAFNCC